MIVHVFTFQSVKKPKRIIIKPDKALILTIKQYLEFEKSLNVEKSGVIY